MSDALACQRDAFGLPEDLHYLNCAYMGPLPRVTEEAGVEGVRRKRVPISIHPEDFFATSDKAPIAQDTSDGGDVVVMPKPGRQKRSRKLEHCTTNSNSRYTPHSTVRAQRASTPKVSMVANKSCVKSWGGALRMDA